MGADGGTISTNRKYLRAAKSGAATGNTRREQRERQRAEELTTCALGGAPLSPPVVACALGYLYNKDAVIRFLLQVSPGTSVSSSDSSSDSSSGSSSSSDSSVSFFFFF